MSTPCRSETKSYRSCLREQRSSGRKCNYYAVKLEKCRQKYRKTNHVAHNFDGTRVLPNKKCRIMNEAVQACLKWKAGKEALCRNEINKLSDCMKTTKGEVAEPTKGDKVWSDYKG
jgi:hypothetical protein